MNPADYASIIRDLERKLERQQAAAKITQNQIDGFKMLQSQKPPK